MLFPLALAGAGLSTARLDWVETTSDPASIAFGCRGKVVEMTGHPLDGDRRGRDRSRFVLLRITDRERNHVRWVIDDKPSPDVLDQRLRKRGRKTQ